MLERAIAVAQVMVDVVRLCEESVGEVFQVDNKADEPEAKMEGGDRPVGADGVLWDSMEEASKNREPPGVKKFEVTPVIAWALH